MTLTEMARDLGIKQTVGLSGLRSSVDNHAAIVIRGLQMIDQKMDSSGGAIHNIATGLAAHTALLNHSFERIDNNEAILSQILRKSQRTLMTKVPDAESIPATVMAAAEASRQEAVNISLIFDRETRNSLQAPESPLVSLERNKVFAQSDLLKLLPPFL